CNLTRKHYLAESTQVHWPQRRPSQRPLPDISEILNMKHSIFYLAFFLISEVMLGQNKHQEDIIDEFVTNCAKRYNYNFQMSEWQECLDEGLKKDSTIAYLWQQKAMPYFKAKKYEIGMTYV